MHSLDILFTQLACVIFWFNPLIWLYRKEVRQNLEHIADFKTQTLSKNDKEYQRLLLKTSVTNHKILISNNFYNSLIKERIVMLKKSRSNRKKQLRYLLIIPLLAGLLMSMNTEEIYVESEKSVIKSNDKTLEFIVTKNTTDGELKSMTEAVEQKGGTLVFSQIKRNTTNELTNIFLKLNNHSYGNSGQPIESFIIYKELFGLGGGYVGRIDGATLHYDNNEKFNDKKASEELQKRAQKAIIKTGIQTKEELKKIKKIRSDYKKSEANKKKKESPKPIKTVSTNKPNKNNKAIAMATPVKVNKESPVAGDISITLISKTTTDSELDDIKEQLKKEGLTAKIKGVKRNKKGEITAIKIEVKSKKSSTSYNVNSDEAIDTIKIVYDEDNNSISIGNGRASHGENTFVYETKGSKHKVHKSGKGSHVYVISEDEHEDNKEHEHDKIYITSSKYKKGKVKRIKRVKNVEVISGDDNEVIEILINEDDDNEHEVKKIIVNGKKVKIVEGKENNIIKGKVKTTKTWVANINDKEDTFIIELDDHKSNIFISDDNGKDPLFILDGKEITKEQMKEVKPDMIESISVLKDKSAIAKYGNKGKDGVIIINTKKKN
jgi:TonB-dependent SusC/RagA subfamily outer membrane receptor